MTDTGELRTERLVLQPLNMSDHAALFAHWTAPKVRQFLFDGYRLSAAEITETIINRGVEDRQRIPSLSLGSATDSCPVVRKCHGSSSMSA